MCILKNMLASWTRRLHFMKIASLPKLIHTCYGALKEFHRNFKNATEIILKLIQKKIRTIKVENYKRKCKDHHMTSRIIKSTFKINNQNVMG